MIETSFIRLKKAILELKDGYPEYVFWGKVEYFLKPGTGIEAVNLLVRHGILEKITEEELKKMTPKQLEKLPRGEGYRLTAKGIDLAISMINLEYTREMRIFTITIIAISTLALIWSFEQLILIYLQNPIF